MNIIQDIYTKTNLALSEKSFSKGEISDWGEVIETQKINGLSIIFVKSAQQNDGLGAFLNYLEAVILDRKNNPTDTSYTASLLARGINKVAQKVGEEAVEVVIEAKDHNKDLFLNESSDLIYHLLVLIVAKNYTLDEVIAVLKKRH